MYAERTIRYEYTLDHIYIYISVASWTIFFQLLLQCRDEHLPLCQNVSYIFLFQLYERAGKSTFIFQNIMIKKNPR